MAARRRKTRTPAAVREPRGAPRLLVRSWTKDAISKELDRLAGGIPDGWRSVVSGTGFNMYSDWKSEFQVGVSADRRAWVLSFSDWGGSEHRRSTPKVKAVVALIDPDTLDENQIVQRLLNAARDWFSILEVDEEGEFDVRLPGVDE